MLGLPDAITACLFDLDGVLTRTSTVHAKAWAQTFDGYLRQRAQATGAQFVPFDPAADYAAHVDGKPRADGVRDFLASRGIVLPEGDRDDGPDAETVNGVGSRKNELVLDLIHSEGVDVYPGSRRYLDEVVARGMKRAVVSSSANAALVLEVTGIDKDIDVLVDGSLAHALQLPGKPAPDTFEEAARRLGVAPEEAAVFEDAQSGVAAGRAGAFGHVIGIDRLDQADALLEQGADVVINDLEELL